MNYFHLSGNLWKPGDIIEPGNWGSLVLNTSGHRWLDMEVIFEHTRQQIAPHLPSRLTSNFVFDNFDSAKKFKDLQRQDDHIYKVAPVDVEAKPYRTSMMLIHPSIGDFEGAVIPFGNAVAYWQMTGGEVHEFEEVLFSCPLMVLGRLEGANYKK